MSFHLVTCSILGIIMLIVGIILVIFRSEVSVLFIIGGVAILIVFIPITLDTFEVINLNNINLR